MKKIFVLLSIAILAGFVMTAQAQTTTVSTRHISFGAVGVDSIVGAATTYRYLNSATPTTGKTAASAPITQYKTFAISAGTVRSVLTGSDSCHIEIQVSLDNTNWVEYTSVTPKVYGGGVYLIGDTRVVTTTDGGGVWQVDTYYPYIRIKFQHFKAACNMYPQAWATFVKM